MERSVALIAVFAALIAALGFLPPLALPIGVPITAQSLGVMLCGTVLGARRGALAALLFIGLVALGLPLLAGGRGGLAVFAGPTAGFVIGFPIAAFVTGFIMERTRGMTVTLASMFAATVGCIGVLYLCGIAGLMVVYDLSFVAAFAALGWYIPGDAAKVVLTGLITAALAKSRPASVMSRA
jgi:biotin transport system substrate-specific component